MTGKMHIAACFLGLLLLGIPARGQQADLSFLLTRAEGTQYQETTRYDELMGFLEVAVSQSPRLHLTTFGYTNEGRALPLVVFGDVNDAEPATVLASGKLRVYIQANIHAGEVEGKEAMLMMIRDLASGHHAAWADSLVLLIAPIYNADGNERVDLNNRPRQHGPIGGMGTRANAQGLDLNRDHMKAQSPEARSLIRLLVRYDPQVGVDLHTTNGTQHAYHLTYSPPLHPNTPTAIDSVLRRQWLPALTDRVRERTGWEMYYYGNLPFRSSEPGWYTFDHRPRFNNNYLGLRNRFAILSEAYAYLPFQDRIRVTRVFVEEILEYARVNASSIARIVAEADRLLVPGDSLGLRAEPRMTASEVTILMGATEPVVNPYSGATMLLRTDVVKPEIMPDFGAFQSTETTRVPSTYYVSAEAAQAVGRLLDTHGIAFSTLTTPAQMEVEVFGIDSTRTAPRPFQDIHERTLFGEWTRGQVRLEAGALTIRTTQPLGRLLFSLIEPRSDDGWVNWAQFDRLLAEDAPYPVVRSLD